MDLSSRKRELLYHPKFSSVPVSKAQIFFQGKLRQYRREHKQFDDFLCDINELLKKETNCDFDNIKKFLNGEPECNWVSPPNSMFVTFINLFNYCFSPEQAVDYIMECYQLYSLLNNIDYVSGEVFNYSIRKSRWDGKPRDFVELSVKPKLEIKDTNKKFRFDVMTSSLVFDGYVLYMPDVEIKVAAENESFFNDTLNLFENFQDKKLYEKVFKTAINGLIEQGVFVLNKEYEDVGYECFHYKVIGGFNIC